MHGAQVHPRLSLEARGGQERLAPLPPSIHTETAAASPDTVTTPSPATQPKEEKKKNDLVPSENWLLVSSFSTTKRLLAS